MIIVKSGFRSRSLPTISVVHCWTAILAPKFWYLSGMSMVNSPVWQRDVPVPHQNFTAVIANRVSCIIANVIAFAITFTIIP